MRPLRALVRSLRRSTSGNATLLVAIGLPMLIGSSGLAVDTAQWYMWRNEMQYAADQAAIAGAWARTSTVSQANYITRARQEYVANLSTVSSFADTANVSLVNFANGSLNSVTVSATATKSLPFTGMLMNRGVTIAVSAQAQFAAGQAYTSCIIATDGSASGSVTIGGSSTLTAKCGIASLSNSASSIVVSGNPDIDAGWVVSKGGIDDWFSLNTNDEVHEYLSGLYDPFANLSPPNNATPQTYNCVNKNGSKLATLAAGTYTSGFKVSCSTVFTGGVYVIDGGGVDVDGQYQVTGSNMIFVLKNGAYIKINGGTNINLTGISAASLIAMGYSSSDANAMDGMLLFEDRNSPGSNKSVLNGNTATILNGTFYFPVSNVTFGGSATVTSRCLMIAADTITISGSADMTSFCPPGMQNTTNISGSAPSVKLVS